MLDNNSSLFCICPTGCNHAAGTGSKSSRQITSHSNPRSLLDWVKFVAWVSCKNTLHAVRINVTSDRLERHRGRKLDLEEKETIFGRRSAMKLTRSWNTIIESLCRSSEYKTLSSKGGGPKLMINEKGLCQDGVKSHLAWRGWLKFTAIKRLHFIMLETRSWKMNGSTLNLWAYLFFFSPPVDISSILLLFFAFVFSKGPITVAVTWHH